MPGHRSYPPLPAALRDEWERIEPSGEGAVRYRPSAAILADGTTVECVYLIDAQSYIDSWGVWPEDDPGKQSVRVDDVRAVAESPHRLPAAFANELYAAGESGMAYCIFTLRFSDGTEQAYLGGNAIDFVPLPAGKSMADIVAVLPHEGRRAPQLSVSPYAWCLFGQGESSHRSERQVDSLNG